MKIYRTYIQQSYFDGINYQKGEVVDIYKEFNVVCQSFPFVMYPEPKELATRDWGGADGRDVYVPNRIPLKHYDLEATFLYKGTQESMRKDISAFISFLYGRNKGAVGGRLFVYNEYVAMGRKDIFVSNVGNDVYDYSDCDPDAVAVFKVKFSVEDPSTEIKPKEKLLLAPNEEKGVVDLVIVE